jgi:hypothetical protein
VCPRIRISSPRSADGRRADDFVGVCGKKYRRILLVSPLPGSHSLSGEVAAGLASTLKPDRDCGLYASMGAGCEPESPGR